MSRRPLRLILNRFTPPAIAAANPGAGTQGMGPGRGARHGVADFLLRLPLVRR